MTAMRVTQPPGIATPLHIHHREAEVFYFWPGSWTMRREVSMAMRKSSLVARCRSSLVAR